VGKYWKTGEIAEITGLSIRTLRYYDQIKLLSPSEYTNSGHRRYTHKDLQNLVEILSLKQMGLSLDEIRTLKEQNNHSTVMNTLNNQIQRIKSDIEIQQQLLKQLEHVHEEFSNSMTDIISLQSLTTLFDLMKANHSKYFSPEQINSIRNHYHSMDEATLRMKEKEFYSILEELREKKEKQIPPTDEAVIVIAVRWNKVMEAMTPKNSDAQKSAELFYSDNPDIATKVGLEPSLYHYVSEALSHISKDS
jgi:DNA-binding transcriptional MerR regulator